MADDPVIAKAIEDITQHDNEAARHSAEAASGKAFVNEYDRRAGREPRYPDVTAPVSGAPITAIMPPRPTAKNWEIGEFFGKPFATAAKTILQARYDAAGKPSPASVDEIRESLLQGTYDFGTTNTEQQKQSIRISLGKNSTTFIRLPNTDLFGLAEWYGQRPRATRSRRNGTESSAPGPADAAGNEEAAGDTAAETVSQPKTEDQ